MVNLNIFGIVGCSVAALTLIFAIVACAVNTWLTADAVLKQSESGLWQYIAQMGFVKI